MPRLRSIVTDPSLAMGLLLATAGMLAAPRAAWAEPDELDEDELDDDELDDDELGDDDEGASASGSASVSLGGGAEADGAATRSKKPKKPKKPKQKDERSFLLRYRPTNHMINAGFYLGGFFRAANHGLADRSLGPQPSTPAGAFDAGFRLEYMPIPYVGVGFESGGMPIRSESEGNARGHFYSVRGHVIGSLPYRLSPTVALGGGLLALASRNADILNGGQSGFHWGPGLKFYVNDWVAVRMDGRHIVTGGAIDGGRSHHGEIMVGAEVTIRLTKWVGAKWRAQRTDSDGDTFADFYDECPDVYGEDENGCPLDRDADKDGVPDRRDACPNEWGDSVDGCPVPDKDGDGILDLDDKCVEEPENYNGIDDEDGCPDELPDEVKKFEGVLKGIYFDTGKSSIRRKSKPLLDDVAAMLSKYPQLRVEISGHTDSKGSHDTNLALSQERADSVKQYLVDKDIAEDRIDTRGVGPDEPIADNGTKRGRSQNRRIEFKVLQ